MTPLLSVRVTLLKIGGPSVGVRTRSDTILISSDPEPYHLIYQPHLNLAIPFPVSPLRIRLSHLASLQSGLCSTFPLSSASDSLS